MSMINRNSLLPLRDPARPSRVAVVELASLSVGGLPIRERDRWYKASPAVVRIAEDYVKDESFVWISRLNHRFYRQ